jgi:hypothetical protein
MSKFDENTNGNPEDNERKHLIHVRANLGPLNLKTLLRFRREEIPCLLI